MRPAPLAAAPRRMAALACALGALIFAGQAWAQDPPKPIEGVIIQVQGEELVVDRGRAHGLEPDARVELFRRLEVTHPATGKKLVDRFPNGALTLTQVGEQLSLARVSAEPRTPPKPGDFIVVTRSPEPTPAPRPEPRPEAVAMAPERAALEATFQASMGKPLLDRIALWEAYLDAHGETAYSDAVGEELAWLRAQLASARQTPAPPSKSAPVGVQGAVSAPRRVHARHPFAITATADTPERVALARVLIRKQGETTYRALALERSGDATWARTFQPSELEAEAVEFFVEAVDQDGTLAPLAGSPHAPETLVIEAPAEDPAPVAWRSRATVVVDRVDFKLGDGDDAYTRVEADYRYKVDVFGLEAVRVGVGQFEGRGASVRDIELGLPSRELTTSYGFAELELGLGAYVGLSGRVLAGNQARSGAETLASVAGFQTALRLGKSDGSNLQLGTTLIESLGVESWIEANFIPAERLSVSGEVIVTNLPVGEDLGVGLNCGLGYTLWGMFTPRVRVGWNARTINHQGMTLGLDTALSW